MSDRIPLGETRREAINRVQELLGPVTPRPLAEQTFWSLAKRGKITMNEEGAYLIEAPEAETEKLRQTATETDQQKQKTQHSKAVRSFTMNHNNMHQARVSTSWNSHSPYKASRMASKMKSMATALAPDLSSEGASYVAPEISSQSDDDSE